MAKAQTVTIQVAVPVKDIMYFAKLGHRKYTRKELLNILRNPDVCERLGRDMLHCWNLLSEDVASGGDPDGLLASADLVFDNIK